MGIRLKTKLSFGLIFLFIVIVLFGVLGIVNINRLSRDLNQVLKNNQESLLYANNMLKALENIRTQKDALQLFEDNLKDQENNITEVGEKEATAELRKGFDAWNAHPGDSSYFPDIRKAIYEIQELNENAILRKHAIAQNTAESAKLWLSIIFTILTLIAFTFIFNLPGIISDPISRLSEGIREIANKNYKKRIFLRQDDEFGDLASSFNIMAEKLDEYESSNLSKIKFEKSRIETIINQMKDGIIGLDNSRNILFINAVAQKLLGLPEKDTVGKYAPDVALKNDLMRTLLRPEDDHKDLKIYADRKESYFSKDIFDVNYNDQLIGQVIVLRNITPFHELNEAKTNFIATVSHELKTPISSIKMSAQLLEDGRIGSLSQEQKELVVSIREDANRMLKLTGELLNMSQAETGKIQLKLQSTPPKSIADLAVQAVQVQAQQKNITLDTQIEEPLPLVQADTEKTTWVLINFLTNAIKYSAEGGSIRIAVYQKDHEVDFLVVDHGKGIDAKYLPKIFDRYFKVPGEQQQGGTGLGLAISKEFIEAQGGTVWVESKLGEGSSFGFTFKST